MANSVRKLVLSNIVSSLAAIQGGAYNFTVAAANVRRVVGAPGSISEYPTLFVKVGPETAARYPTERDTFRIDVEIEAIIIGDPSTIPDLVEDIVEDIRRAMSADYTRGAKALETDDKGVSAPVILDQEGGQRASVSVRYSIMYRHQILNPSAT